jgi:transmembrane sensor
MSRPNIEDLLDRYFNRKTTAEENELVEQWLENYDSGSGWNDMNATGRKVWLDELFNEVQESISADTPVTVVPLKKGYPWFRYVAAIAASAAVFFMLYMSWPDLYNKISSNNLITLRVPLDQTRQITLSDGSKIWVNAGSELRYPQAFDGKKREVFLNGEAYFDINHDKAKPFIVHTGKLTTTVLGTAFNIKALKPAEAVVVTVTRGKVSVANGTRLLGYLTPNRQLTFNKLSQQSIQKLVNASEVIAWQKESEIHFEDITFGEAARQLEQRFKVSISFKTDKVKNCRFSGTALQGKNLDQILKIICAFNNASYHRNENGSIIVEGQGCN